MATVITIVNYEPKTFIVQATDVSKSKFCIKTIVLIF